MKRRGTIRIGISGWTYPPWRKVFYPEGLPPKRELEYAAARFASIEINGSFYSLQRPESYQAWYKAAPRGFIFAVKGSRYITHLRRLKDIRLPLANFLASGLLGLREKLGPILWQLPPNFRYDRERLVAFFKILPRDTGEAAKLARKHDGKVRGRALVKVDRIRPLRHALEVRHTSFETKEFVDLLREHRIGLVVADTAGKWPFLEDVTSDFIYVRLHGDEELYRSGYTGAALALWARKIQTWAAGGTPASTKRLGPRLPVAKSGRDVYVYFDNDAKVHAPFDAVALARRLGLGPAPPAGP
ncbi:MAG: DUF72 domain-containing protein [Chthoniobacter sp.]|nr:DUF72 domain-containing protein [Chthoniobacter sp.]